MSSVRDRIRNLQAAGGGDGDGGGGGGASAASVQARAREVERVLSEGGEAAVAKPLSQLASRFDRAGEEDDSGGRALSSRVAQFDAISGTDSVQSRAKRLQSEGQSGSVAGRAAAFQEADGDGAKRFVERVDSEGGDGLHKARAKFESGGGDTERSGRVAHAVDAMKEESNDEKGKISKRAALFENSQSKPLARPTPSLMSFGSDDSAAATNKVATNKVAAVREEAVQATAPKKAEEKSVHEQLREMKRANEQLVSTLLELTASFKTLERTRDQLQLRLSKLENK